MAGPSVKDLVQRVERLEQLLGGRIPGGGVTDPAPDPGGGWFPRPPFPFPFPFPFPQPGDPSPIDLSRLNKAQLTVTKEMIKAERVRLDAMEKFVDEQIKSSK